MKIYLSNQQRKFPQHLESLCRVPVMKYDMASLPEKTSAVEINVSLPFDRIDTSFLFAYDIFPGYIMERFTQWASEHRPMRVGDTIVQQVHLPTMRSLSQKIIFGVRIDKVIDEPNRKGYSYETLEGHVERGRSLFLLEYNEAKLKFVIRTWSEPSSALLKLVGPVFALPYQAYCTRQALANVKKVIEAQH